MPTSSVPPPPAAAPAEPRPARVAFRHARSRLVAASGAPNHRGRDVLAAEGEPQLIEVKIAYGPTDKDLKDEDVLVEGETDRGWEPLGVARTSVDGPGDDGGRVRLELTQGRAFGLGRHRVRVTVLGDGSLAELAVVVVPRAQPIFVSDVDGTLTESEIAELPALARGALPAAHEGAAAVLSRLAARGLVPVYLTARPEWLVARTRAFLADRSFPTGVLITRRDKSGGYGASAAAFKEAELRRLASVFRVDWAFGNMPSDAEAYAAVVSDPRRRILYRYEDGAHRGRRIESYHELLPEIDAAP